MTLAARDSSISPALPQRLLVPVLQMLHDGPEPLCCSEWPAVTANALGLSDEFSCHFNYAAIHSVTQCVQGLQLEDYAERMKCGRSGLRLVWYVGLLMHKTDVGCLFVILGCGNTIHGRRMWTHIVCIFQFVEWYTELMMLWPICPRFLSTLSDQKRLNWRWWSF